MARFAIQKSGEHLSLTLDGDLTNERAEEIRNALIEALDKADRIEVNVEGAAEVTLPCLQLLCAAHRTALMRGKRLTLTGQKPENFKKMMKDAGYQRHIGCELDHKASCLWLKEDNV